MPQLIVLAVAGAGLIAGYKWVSRKVTAHMKAAEELRGEAARKAAGLGPKEMGELEWDADAQAYRPARRPG